MEHKVLRHTVIDDLNSIINQHLEAGWTLQGQMFMGIGIYCQCIVVESDTVTLSQEAHDSLISDQETLALIRKEGYSNQ